MWQVTIRWSFQHTILSRKPSMLIMIKSNCTVERCDHVDDQVVTESPSTGGWRRGVSAGVWVSAVAWLGPHSFLVSHSGMEWAELGVTGPSVPMCISGRAITRPFPHLDYYFQLRFIADDKKILISRLMTTLARAEHHSTQLQIPGRGKFQGDTHQAPRPARGAPEWIWITVSFSSQVWQSAIGHTPSSPQFWAGIRLIS